MTTFALALVLSAAFCHAILRSNVEIVERARRVEAERANKVTSHFIANVSHELRTPLNAIIGFSKINSDGEMKLDKAKTQEYAEYIYDSSENLLAYINDILDMSKIQSGKIDLYPEKLVLGEVLGACLTLFKMTVADHNIDLIVEFDDDLPEIEADPIKLKQIFTNLLSNAFKFTPEHGSIAIAAKNLDEGRVEVKISDTGIGMHPDNIETALAPFGQVHAQLNREVQGTGLGLPIAKSLVELHLGVIEVTSTEYVGTTVRIELPVKSAIVRDMGADSIAA